MGAAPGESDERPTTTSTKVALSMAASATRESAKRSLVVPVLKEENPRQLAGFNDAQERSRDPAHKVVYKILQSQVINGHLQSSEDHFSHPTKKTFQKIQGPTKVRVRYQGVLVRDFQYRRELARYPDGRLIKMVWVFSDYGPVGNVGRQDSTLMKQRQTRKANRRRLRNLGC